MCTNPKGVRISSSIGDKGLYDGAEEAHLRLARELEVRLLVGVVVAEHAALARVVQHHADNLDFKSLDRLLRLTRSSEPTARPRGNAW